MNGFIHLHDDGSAMNSQSTKTPVVLFGNSKFASNIYYYLSHDSDLEVVAFTVDAQYIESPTKHGLPVMAFESLELHYPPDQYQLLIALGFQKQNKLRYERFLQAKAKGYSLASYVSSRASIWNTKIRENTIILDGTVVHPFVSIGNNTIISSCTFIAHHSEIGNHCFISGQVALAGSVILRDFSFVGINATVKEEILIGRSCTIAAGATVVNDIADGEIVMGTPARSMKSA